MDNYIEKIKKGLINFCNVGQDMVCNDIFKKENQMCQLCGHTPITLNFNIKNISTNENLIVGKRCFRQIIELVDQLQLYSRLYLPKKYGRLATDVADKYPDIVEIIEGDDMEMEEVPDEEMIRKAWEEDQYPDPAPEEEDGIDWDSVDWDND